MKKITYAVTGAAFALLLIVLAVGYAYSANVNKTVSLKNGATKVALALDLNINKIGERSFGVLSGASSSGQAKTISSSIAPVGRGGGGIAQNSAVAEDAAVPMMPENAKMMPPFMPQNFHYVYKGKEIKIDSDRMEVLKRIKGVSTSVNALNIAQSLNFGLADLSGFPDLEIQNVNFVQKGGFGYIISVLLDEGMVNISQNWETWPAAKCLNDMKCYEQQRVKIEDIPSDEELVNIADNFLIEHAIEKKFYGAAEVVNNQKFGYENAENKADYYIQENIEIVYPLKINEKYVYEEFSGAKQGLTVSINIKSKKVIGVSNLTTQNYESSDYEVETDGKKIQSIAEKGGSPGYRYANQGKEVDIDLGDPSIEYMKYYSYKDGKSEELLTPAMVFPVVNVSKEARNFYQKNIIVPLVKEILSERGTGDNIPIPTPILYDKTTTTGVKPGR